MAISVVSNAGPLIFKTERGALTKSAQEKISGSILIFVYAYLKKYLAPNPH